ncbi:MAG: electron transport complex subunit E [Ruminococcus flavefaciens]|nr:electron transport complex subunit E [Ruminococcus flavefaciens]MCM1231636.1 electron transport complex subunit E [Ruminococcus flavefaciens]
MAKKNSVFDGLLGDNTVLSSLMVISPVIVCGDTLRNAIAVIYAFSAITFLSVLAGSFVPKKLPYALKIITYTLISSLVYLPVKLASQQFFPEVTERIGIYFMLLAVNSLIIVQTEAKFYRMKRGRMIVSLIFYILGFDAVMVAVSFVRELISHGTIYDRVVDIDTLVSGFGMPFGGFIFLGLFCGIYRKIRSALKRENAGGDGNVSDN